MRLDVFSSIVEDILEVEALIHVAHALSSSSTSTGAVVRGNMAQRRAFRVKGSVVWNGLVVKVNATAISTGVIRLLAIRRRLHTRPVHGVLAAATGLDAECNDTGCVVTLVGKAELGHSFLEIINHVLRCTETHHQRNNISEAVGSSLVKNEEAVEERVRSLDDVTLHLLELGVEERNLGHIKVITHHVVTGRSVDSYTVTNIERMLDENEDDGLEELLGGSLENPGQTQYHGTCRAKSRGSRSRKNRDEDNDGNDDDDKHKDLVEFLNHRIKILERSSDGLLFEMDFVADSFEFVNRDVTVHILVKHHESNFGLLFAAKDSFHVILVHQIVTLLGSAAVDETSKGVCRLSGSEKFINNSARVVAVNLATDQVVSDSASHVSNLVKDLTSIILECLHWSLRATSRATAALEEVIGLFVVSFGMFVQMNQLPNIRLVVVDSSRIGSLMESESDPLNEDLLNKVESCQCEQSNDDLVHDADPMRLLVSEVVVHHGRFKGNEDGEEPEEDGRVQVKLVSDVFPLAGVGGPKEFGNKFEGWG
ncbi:hypothetical protein HG531_006544 [Fusarium graminearum]|nr:hypothetical protein HG531_006544 [Fusarium graminearum]